MVITFVSNYINHHQMPFCRAMMSLGDDVSFYFIQTMPMEEKRKSMGWDVNEEELSYVVLYYKEKERAEKLILESDAVLIGWTEGLASDVIEKRLSSGKLSFRVSERIYREGQWKFLSPRGLRAKYNEHYRFRKSPVYLLCTGAYVASDFDLIKSYPGKMLKWGYFPDAGISAEAGDNAGVADAAGKSETADGVKGSGGDSAPGTLRLLWAGRLIELKHPEFAVRLADDLKKSGKSFTLEIVGDGPLKESLAKEITEKGLSDCVSLEGGKKPSGVPGYMNRADVFLFTSNYLEGWGAVVNEAMQCGCAVVASGEAGAVPFLIEDGKNGLSYDHGSFEEFEKKVLYLFDNPEKVKELADRASDTIKSTWNAKKAATELLRFCREYESGETPRPAADGPMSSASVLTPPGFKRTLEEKNRLE